jgi:hypothetical protein
MQGQCSTMTQCGRGIEFVWYSVISAELLFDSKQTSTDSYRQLQKQQELPHFRFNE